MNYGNRIKELRRKYGFQQQDLAKKLDMARSSLSDIERSAYPPLNRIHQICDIFNIPIWQFFIDSKEVSKAYNISKDCLDLAIEIERLDPHKKNLFLKHILTGLDLLD